MRLPNPFRISVFRGSSVKSKLFAAAVAAAFLMNAPAAFAQAMTADDLAWINKCVADNKRGGASREVVRKYCICMNEKMDDGETLSITAWERKNPAAMAACDKESGWK
jgi:hypothetical protein